MRCREGALRAGAKTISSGWRSSWGTKPGCNKPLKNRRGWSEAVGMERIVTSKRPPRPQGTARRSDSPSGTPPEALPPPRPCGPRGRKGPGSPPSPDGARPFHDFPGPGRAQPRPHPDANAQRRSRRPRAKGFGCGAHVAKAPQRRDVSGMWRALGGSRSSVQCFAAVRSGDALPPIWRQSLGGCSRRTLGGGGVGAGGRGGRDTPNFGALCTAAGTTALGIHSGYTKKSSGARTVHTRSFCGTHRTDKNKILGYARTKTDPDVQYTSTSPQRTTATRRPRGPRNGPDCAKGLGGIFGAILRNETSPPPPPKEVWAIARGHKTRPAQKCRTKIGSSVASKTIGTFLSPQPPRK